MRGQYIGQRYGHLLFRGTILIDNHMLNILRLQTPFLRTQDLQSLLLHERLIGKVTVTKRYLVLLDQLNKLFAVRTGICKRTRST